MAGVAGDEHAGKPLRGFLFRHVVELVAKPLADLVDRPPGDFFHLERIGLENPLRRRDQIIGGNVPIPNPFGFVELVDLDIDPDQIATFPRDENDVAFRGPDQ